MVLTYLGSCSYRGPPWRRGGAYSSRMRERFGSVWHPLKNVNMRRPVPLRLGNGGAASEALVKRSGRELHRFRTAETRRRPPYPNYSRSQNNTSARRAYVIQEECTARGGREVGGRVHPSPSSVPKRLRIPRSSPTAFGGARCGRFSTEHSRNE